MKPPGYTEDVHVESALVLAPHYDDEVLGCGGLLARLTDSGAAVRVLFLTDSGGGRGEAQREGQSLEEEGRDDESRGVGADQTPAA